MLHFVIAKPLYLEQYWPEIKPRFRNFENNWSLLWLLPDSRTHAGTRKFPANSPSSLGCDDHFPLKCFSDAAHCHRTTKQVPTTFQLNEVVAAQITQVGGRKASKIWSIQSTNAKHFSIPIATCAVLLRNVIETLGSGWHLGVGLWWKLALSLQSTSITTWFKILPWK